MTTDDAHLSATGSASKQRADRSTWRYLKDMQLPPDVQQLPGLLSVVFAE